MGKKDDLVLGEHDVRYGSKDNLQETYDTLKVKQRDGPFVALAFQIVIRVDFCFVAILPSNFYLLILSEATLAIVVQQNPTQLQAILW